VQLWSGYATLCIVGWLVGACMRADKSLYQHKARRDKTGG